MRLLNPTERSNLAFLTSNDIPHGLLQLTRTGLEKSILDATQEFRNFLLAYGIHDYARQHQGPGGKREIVGTLFASDGSVSSRGITSLYRPVTKKGDPRVWISGLRAIAGADSIVAVIWRDQALWVFNLSDHSIESRISDGSMLSSLLLQYLKSKSQIVDSLLDLLRSVANKGYLRAPVMGSTAVGRLLESELGIEINSRKAPDFHGIELKASRTATNRTTLFAKTPDWDRSRYKRSAEILSAFGYDRGGVRKLSCTLSGRVVNSQGLSLVVNQGQDELHAVSDRPDPRVAVWDLGALRHSLAIKHDETFWVKADTKLVDGWEYIKFTEVVHTSKPMIDLLAPALENGVVTLDFLIREAGDKGYLFKLLPKNLQELFPPSRAYALST